jgi:hypothetical protein
MVTRTQIQLPDDLYTQAKRLAERHEISLAELLRRGLEHMLRVYRADEPPRPEWRLPDALPLGEFLVPVEDWREHANIAGTADPESS